MKDRYLKARVPSAVYEALLARAGASGLRLGTLVRETLERDAQVVSTTEALARIESALAASQAVAAPAPPATFDHDLHRQVQELRLIVREIAMQLNAQILSRVAAQIAANASTNQASRSN